MRDNGAVAYPNDSEPPDGGEPGQGVPERRAAQDAAAELARMGIEPQLVGLDPVPLVHQPAAIRVRGVAAVPSPRTDADQPREQVPPDGARFGAALGAAAWTAPVPAEVPPASGDRPVAPAGSDPFWFTPAPPLPPSAPEWAVPPPDRAAPAPDRAAPSPPPERLLTRPLGDTVPPAQPPVPDPGRLVEPVTQVAETHQIVLPAAWRRAVRAVTLGLLRPGAAAAVQHERLLVTRVRARRREPWTVAFVAGKGGVGTTTTAIGVAWTLATLRTDSTALVDARSGTGSLGQRLAGRPAPTVMQRADQAALTPLRVRGALGVVDGTPWDVPATRDDLMRAMVDLRQSNAFTLVDVGNDVSEAGRVVLDSADQAVLVTTTSQDAVEAVWIALNRVRRVEPRRLATLAIAVVCRTSRQYRFTVRRLHTKLGLPRHHIVAVPHDPVLVAGSRFEPTELRAPTREAFLRLAALVADPLPAA